ncbi:rifin [Plasmodium reichenowi]|uniref:Rifin n=1 Tax=Plasmodium reichenowi TaxID=5854 RepID=A0A060RQI5_PLARE|nr:rifin [Plasmodium reichenowi]
MKLHYTKILLFVIPLNILVTSYHEHNNNEPHITPHHTLTTTSRVLSECNTQSSIYDNDAEMKSVMQQFDDRTSQRFEEYEEHMENKRQKRKEQRDKNIEEIIKKDRMEKSLAEKIEKGCLKCGCALGGVAASVGIFGTVAVKELTKAAITAAEITAKEAAIAEATAKGAAAGKQFVIAGLERMGISTLNGQPLKTFFDAQNYNNAILINGYIKVEYNASSCLFGRSSADPSNPICPWANENFFYKFKHQGSVYDFIKKTVENIVSEAEIVSERAVKTATEQAIEASTVAAESTYAGCQTAIIASVVAILVIVLVMIIIYLVLRFRRKKKMNKKAQYTKLLKE